MLGQQSYISHLELWVKIESISSPEKIPRTCSDSDWYKKSRSLPLSNHGLLSPMASCSVPALYGCDSKKIREDCGMRSQEYTPPLSLRPSPFCDTCPPPTPPHPRAQKTQIVMYPIMNLRRYRQDIHWYLRALEETVIRTLAKLGLRGERIKGLTGVWVEGRKVAVSCLCCCGQLPQKTVVF